MPLSDMQCRTAKPKEKPYKLSDMEGLYLQIMPSSAKYWRLKYRIHGKEKLISLGVYPKISLAEARKQKDSIKEELKNGLNPALVRLEKKQTATFNHNQTFELIAKEWHAKNVPQWHPRYAQTVMHRLEKYAFLEIGCYPIHLLKPVIILACLQKIEKTAPEMARRIKQLCSHVFKYAIATNRIETDVTYGLENALKKYKKGHFASIEVDELPDLVRTLHNHKARLYRQTYLAIKLMLLTFVRTSELIEAKWSEINFEQAIWAIPAERMKMRLPHLVPLSRQSLAILEELKEMNGKRDHVFPSIPRPRKPMSKGTILVALKRMGYSKRMTGHGFRSLALGVLKEKLGYSHEIADRQLAHSPKSSTDRAYDRAKFLTQRIAMMQQYSDYLDSL
ncbi:integrase [Adhaeribacter arboris]|uniref:Integrase n=1 Tax=Adhaeribacter arboris TaxID=2072846 RepID=A0A2T2YMA3_9BACT|nr:integrase arm-type DNA-binding domain-containing protein [Adhaeribacter arboris]PSR56643.1 integrase [Adhaeribacter arboris]